MHGLVASTGWERGRGRGRAGGGGRRCRGL